MHRKWCISEWHPTRDDCTCAAALQMLAHNFMIAGALFRAFALGGDRARWMSDYFEGYYDDDDDAPWAPGEGRSSP